MGSSRKHRDKERESAPNSKPISRSRSKSKDREKHEKTEKSERSGHRSGHRHKDKEGLSGSRKRQRAESCDEERADRSDKKLKVKEVKDVSKCSNTSVNKTVKLDQKSSEETDRTGRRDAHTKEDIVRNDGSNTESLSIEETNKLRLKLGLKPLDEESEGKPNESTQTVEVFVKTEKISDKIEAQKIREKIENQRNKRKIIEKLKKVKTLADSDSEDDASAWVQKNRHIQEEKARALKRAQLLEEMDEEFGVSSLMEEEVKRNKAKAYSSKDLKGLSVGHKTDSFKEGQQLILTLKDKDVLNEDEDVLENVNLVDDQKANKNIENRAKRPDYKPYDEPEFDEFGILKKKTLLSKYDEEIDGVKKDSFKLGISGADRAQEMEMIRMKLKQEVGKISLIVPKPQIANEYYTEEEMTKFKKPKKVRKVMRKKTPIVDKNEEPIGDYRVSADHGSRKTKKELNEEKAVIIKSDLTEEMDPKMRSKPSLDSIVVDDDIIGSMDEDLSGIVLEEDEADKELQNALHKARKLKMRDDMQATTGAASIVKVAQTVRTQNNLNEDLNDDSEQLTSISNNIILNSTAEFCRNLGDIPTYGLAGNRDDDEELMDLERELQEEIITDLDPNRGQWSEVEVKEEDVAEELADDTEGQPILEEEPDVSKGLAGALQLAMKKGYLDKEIKKHSSASRQSLLEAQSYTIEEKFYEEDKIGRRERYSGPVSDFREKSGYKPEIKLDYVDEKGRVLDQKEAFRHLSHKFHGKGPSKNKIDKRMKKKDQESKLRQMSSTDTPLNTLRMLTEKQKELQSPYIVLTGGQKTAIQTTISKTK